MFCYPFGKTKCKSCDAHIIYSICLTEDGMKKKPSNVYGVRSCLSWICAGVVGSFMPKSIAKSVPYKNFTFVYVYGQRPLKMLLLLLLLLLRSYCAKKFYDSQPIVCHRTADSSDFSQKEKYPIQVPLIR